MKYLLLFLIAFSLGACSNPEDGENPTESGTKETVEDGTVEEQMMRHIKSKLKINAVEKFDLEVYKAELTQDDSTDWIITINLLDRALNEAATSNREKQMGAVGYMGHYNYFFFMDGATKKISEAVVAPSSAYAGLIVAFENITSDTKKDFTIDLKIRNSRRRLFYTIKDGTPFQVCEEVIFYNYGKEDSETQSTVIEFEEIEGSSVKNIAVYEGVLEQTSFENKNDVYDADPTITSNGKMIRRWYLDPRFGKYYMKKGEF